MSVGDDTVYSVVVFEYPAGKGPSPDARRLRQAGERLRQGQRVPLAQEGAGDHRRPPGFEAIADDSKGKLSHLIDVVPAGDRIYMLVTAGAQEPRHRATTPSASAIPSACSATSRAPVAIRGQSADAQ